MSIIHFMDLISSRFWLSGKRAWNSHIGFSRLGPVVWLSIFIQLRLYRKAVSTGRICLHARQDFIKKIYIVSPARGKIERVASLFLLLYSLDSMVLVCLRY